MGTSIFGQREASRAYSGRIIEQVVVLIKVSEVGFTPDTRSPATVPGDVGRGKGYMIITRNLSTFTLT